MIYGTPEFEDLIYAMILTPPGGKEHGKRHALYDITVQKAKDMRIHVFGDKPTEILKRVRPGEPDEITKYRECNYEPTTKSTASKGLSIISKIFNPSLSSIEWKDQTVSGVKLEKFALEYYPKHNSIIKFLAEAGIKRIVADPNGVFTVRPSKVPDSDLEMVLPEVKVYGSPAVWWYDEDCYIIHLKTEDVRGRRWEYFEYYDRVQIIQFAAQIVTSQKVEILETEPPYPHNFREIPVWFLGGETETDDNGNEYYISFFEPALPFWNKAVSGESDLDAHFIMHQYPQKVIEGVECDFVFKDQRCQHGRIPVADGGWETCPSCKGSGTRVPVGPYGYYIKTREKLDAGTQVTDPVQYVTVPSDPTKMLSERVENLHKKGLSALNMDIVDSVGENQSGIAKVIDRGELYDFLYKIADLVYDTHLQNFFYFFNLYMFGVQDNNPGRKVDKNLPEIRKPKNFDLSSVAEKTALYAEAKKATMSPEYLRQKSIEITGKDFGTNPDIQRKVITCLELDPLPEISPVDLETNLSLGIISKKDAVIHANISTFVDQASQKDAQFWGKTKKEKTDIISKLAEEFLKDNQVKLTVQDDTEGTGESDRKRVA